MMEDNLGRQALHIAAQTGAVKAMKYLVSDCGVDPVATCPGNGASALHIAAKVSDIDTDIKDNVKKSSKQSCS